MTMPKDSKDWTWVLDRPCPECRFEAAKLDRSEVASALRANAAAWPSVLAGPDADRRPSAEVWSPLEYGCHVRDVFRIYDARLERMLTEDDPLYPNWDQDQTAIDDRYGEQDPAQVGRELVDAAAALADRFETVAGDGWQRSGRRSDGASFTVESFARYLVHDPVHHLHDVGGR